MESTLVKFASVEWDQIKKNFEYSKKKCNKDLICVACWRVINYEESRKHRVRVPEHEKQMLPCRSFASEAAFIALAKEHKKIFKSKGEVMLISPYQKEQKRRDLKAEEKTGAQSPKTCDQKNVQNEVESAAQVAMKEKVHEAIYSLCSQVQEMEAQIQYFTSEYQKTLGKIQSQSTASTTSSQSPESLLSKSSLASNSCSSSEEATARFGGCLTPEEQKTGQLAEQQIDMRKAKSLAFPLSSSKPEQSKKLIKLPALKRRQRPLLLSQFQKDLFLLPQHKICTEDEPEIKDIFNPFRKEEKALEKIKETPSVASQEE